MSEHLSIDRTFQAPRARVWHAWTDPEAIAEWWGPDGFHVPRHSIDLDLRDGGHFNLTMVEAGNSTELPVRFRVDQIVEHQLLVFFSAAQPELGSSTDTTTRVSFGDVGQGTLVKLGSGPYTSEMARSAELGWERQFDKLAQLLAR